MWKKEKWSVVQVDEMRVALFLTAAVDKAADGVNFAASGQDGTIEGRDLVLCRLLMS